MHTSARERSSQHAFAIFAEVTSALALVAMVLSVAEVTRAHAVMPMLALIAATAVASRFPIRVAGHPAIAPASQVLGFVAALILGPGAAALTVAFDRAASWLAESRAFTWRAAVNVSVPIVAIWTASSVYHLALGPHAAAIAAGTASVGFSGVLMATLCFAIRTGLAAIADAFERRQRPAVVWRTHAAFLAVTDHAALSVAMILVAERSNSWLDFMAVAGLLVVVAYVAYQAFADQVRQGARQSDDLERLYQAAIETLAIAVDAKDQVTHGHIRRVQRHALAVARAIGVQSPAQLKALEAAALLHDIGKLAVPDYVLNKPGTLTRREFDLMKLHADKGASILSGVDFPFPVVPIVRHHHEQWNGAGYPDGLSGDTIPIGARLLAVVDCFDALTSDRPYRRKLTDEAAIAILRQRSGSYYDPRVVTTFIDLVPTLRAQDVEADAQAERPAVPLAPPTRAAEGTQTLKVVEVPPDSVGALLRIRMTALLPDAAFCLWIPDERGERLKPLHVSHAIQPTLAGVEVRVGSGLAGWVAANRHTIINSPPDLDLLSESGDPALRKCVCTPVFAFGTIAGVLAAYTGRVEGFSDREVRIVGALAQELGIEFASHDRDLVYDFSAPAVADRTSKIA